MNRHRLILAALFLTILAAESALAATGSTGWPIFRRPKSSKPDSITAVASIRGDLSGVFYNPSTLGTIQKSELFCMMETGMAEDSFMGVLYGQPLGKSGLAVGYVTYDAGSTQLFWIDGGSEMSSTVHLQQDSLVMLAYGFSIGSHFSMGVSAKYATSNIAEQTPNANAICGDVGFILTQGINGFSLSLAGQNIGSATAFVTTAETLPQTGWCGLSYSHTVGKNNFIAIGTDVGYLVSEARVLPGFGIEYDIGNFQMNVGYYGMRTDEGTMQVGLGFTSGTLEIGMAILPTSNLNQMSRFNVSLLF